MSKVAKATRTLMLNRKDKVLEINLVSRCIFSWQIYNFFFINQNKLAKNLGISRIIRIFANEFTIFIIN